MAGYSGTPLWKKLGLKPGHVLAVLGQPEGWIIEDLPEDVVLRSRTRTPLDVIVAFFNRRSELERRLPALIQALRADGSLWIAWPRKAAGHASDISENGLRAIVLPTGLVDTKVAALDADWSGLKFVWRKELRSSVTARGLTASTQAAQRTPEPSPTRAAVDGHVTEADPSADDVRELIGRHLRFTGSASPAEFAFALRHGDLVDPAVTLFGLRVDGELLAVGALKHLDDSHVELKSMHTAEEAVGRGLGRRLLEHLVATARAGGYGQISLETGTTDEFAPARALYIAAGFRPCSEFADYKPSDWNTFMSLGLPQ